MLTVYLLIASLFFSAFFSGMEIAFVSSNRMLAEMDREKHRLSQKALDIFYSHPNNFVMVYFSHRFSTVLFLRSSTTL